MQHSFRGNLTDNPNHTHKSIIGLCISMFSSYYRFNIKSSPEIVVVGMKIEITYGVLVVPQSRQELYLSKDVKME